MGQAAVAGFVTTVAAILLITAAGMPSNGTPRLSLAIMPSPSGSIATPSVLKLEQNSATALDPSLVVQAPANVGVRNLTRVQIIMLIDTAMGKSTLSDLIRFGAMVIIAFVAFTCLLHHWTSPRTLETLQRFHIQFAKDADIFRLPADDGCSTRQNLNATDISGQRRQSVTCATLIEHPHYSGPPA